MKRWTGWRLALRIARREAWRAKARSLLILAMIALPVTAVTAATILIRTADLDSAESLDRRMGTQAAAMMKITECGLPTEQGIDPFDSGWGSVGEDCVRRTEAEVLAATESRPATLIRESYVAVKTDRGQTDADGRELALGDPLTEGLYDLVDGRWPTAVGEVVVNATLAGRGPELGEQLVLLDREGNETTREIVGIAESSSVRGGPVVAGLPGSLGFDPASGNSDVSWLLGGGPMAWDEVRALNRVGAVVLSREMVLRPSPEAQDAEQGFAMSSDVDDSVIAVVALVVVMVLIEVVLLAGPAFAVGARRQSRDLALLVAAGGTPKQARRVVLATGVVLGVVAGVGGIALGLAAAWLIEPLIQRSSYSWFGPFEVPWAQVVGVGVFGLASALLAALVPARIAARQDVVAVLAGRRGDRRPSLRSPATGAALLGLGVAAAAIGAPKPSSSGAIWIASSAILSVLGMLLLVPVVVVGVSRLGRWLPLSMRFAVRDAARNRARTTPAVAAVAATIAGVVTLGIGVSSDEMESRASYEASLPLGMAAVTSDSARTSAEWAEPLALVRAQLPGATVEEIEGVGYGNVEPDEGWTHVTFEGSDDAALMLSGYGGVVPAATLVAGPELPAYLRMLMGSQADAAAGVLGNGGVVVFADNAAPLDQVRATSSRYDDEGEEQRLSSEVFPAVVVAADGSVPARAVISPQAAQALSLPVSVVGLVIGDAEISPAASRDLLEALRALPQRAWMYVERGYEPDDSAFILQLVLAGLGAVLMLGGTLTATFLALSDARPDFATLSAIGAAPRTRRGIASAYSLVVGGVGAILGVVVGFIPGVAIAYSATNQRWLDPCRDQVDAATCVSDLPSFYLDVPWELIGGLVVVLPLAVGALIWLTVRSRLPVVARLA